MFARIRTITILWLATWLQIFPAFSQTLIGPTDGLPTNESRPRQTESAPASQSRNHNLPPLLDLPQLVSKVKPSVVSVSVYDGDDTLISRGSGFFIKGGRLVTSHHVLSGGRRAEIRLAKGEILSVLGILADDADNDLILLSVQFLEQQVGRAVDPDAIPSLLLADANPAAGEKIAVVGNPLGLDHTVSDGIISAVREVNGSGTLLQITAPISPGSSGGPVLNMRGEVVGVVRSFLSAGQALNFAVSTTNISKMKVSKAVPLSLWNIPKSSTAFLSGVAMKSSGRWNEALDNFRQAEQDEPGNPKIKIEIGWCLTILGDRDAAEQSFTAAMKTGACTADSYYSIASFYSLGEKDPVRLKIAVSILKSGLKIDPDHELSMDCLGIVYEQLQDFDKALEARKLLVALRPSSVSALVALGSAYQNIGLGSEAQRRYSEATKLKPETDHDYIKLSVAYGGLKKPMIGLELLREGIERFPKSFLLHAVIGDELVRHGFASEARQKLETAILLGAPTSWCTKNLMAAYLNEKLDVRESIAHRYRREIAENPENPRYHFLLGLLDLARGRQSTALAEYKILKELKSDLAEDLFNEIYP